MSPAMDQSEYCKLCELTLPSWEEYFLHKIQSKKHICCVFCGQDFKTHDGCKRHMHQDHAAEQNLSCAGCGMVFVRVGSYISHIEHEQCPVIHKSLLEARCAERDGQSKDRRRGVPFPPTTVPSVAGKNVMKHDDIAPMDDFEEGPLVFDENPQETSWEQWGEELTTKVDDLREFPSLPMQDYRNGNSKVPDLLTGTYDKLDEKNLAWIEQKALFPYTPSKLLDTRKKTLATVTVDKPNEEEEYHPYDPDNPEFDIKAYRNPITGKYRCAWPGCTKLQKHANGLVNHLRSPAHMNKQLRCPGCLRQYASATALVQHAEAQAVKCQVRESDEYKKAVDQITGGFVDTAGRHNDNTIRYIAPDAAATLAVGPPVKPKIVLSDEAYWEEQEKIRQEQIQKIAENGDW